MKILAIETASEACSVALRVGDDTLERYVVSPRGHAERVLPWVNELLTEAGLPLGGLDLIAFSRGPGSFTSLRIGISLVQGLAWGADLPVAPLSSLRIAAQVAANRGVRAALVAMDARMGEVFCGAFALGDTGVMLTAGPERVCSPAEAAGLARAERTGVGNGFARYGELAEAVEGLEGVLPDVWPRAAAMLPLVDDWLRDHVPRSALEAQPVYLRDQVAKKSEAP